MGLLLAACSFKQLRSWHGLNQGDLSPHLHHNLPRRNSVKMGHSEPKLQRQQPCPYQADRRVHCAPGCTGGQATTQQNTGHTWHKELFAAAPCPTQAAACCFLSLFARVLRAQDPATGKEEQPARFLFGKGEGATRYYRTMREQSEKH